MERRKIWVGVGAVLWASASAGGLHADAAPPLSGSIATPDTEMSAGSAWRVAPTDTNVTQGGGGGGGEGGEGEGEGGGAAKALLMQDDVALATHLGMIEGHLRVAARLYEGEHIEQAGHHAGHPRGELLGGLRPALQARGLEPLDVELRRLAAAVDRVTSTPRRAALIGAATEAVQMRIDGLGLDSRQRLAAAAALLRMAGLEYGTGLDDAGRIQDRVEYQDAWGFVQVAKRLLDATRDDLDADLWAELAAEMTALDDLWGPLDRAEHGGDPARLHVMAARLDFSASRL